MRATLARIAFRTAATYVVLGGLWILFSDALLVALVSDPVLIGRLAVVKGWFFVIISALAIYAKLKRQLSHWEHEAQVREKAEAALRASDERFRSALAFLPIPIGIANQDGTVIYYNRAFTENYGYTTEDTPTIQQWVLLAYPDPVSREAALKLWEGDIAEALRQQTASTPREYTITTKDGRQRSVEITARSVGGLLITSFNDTSERKQAEAALDSERRFLADMIENSGSLVMVKDKEGHYELVNRKWEEITGHPREQAYGRTDLELFPGPEGEQFRENDLMVMRSGLAHSVEETLGGPSGTRHFLSVKFPKRDAFDRVRGVCGMVTEITERKRAEALVVEQNRVLEMIASGVALGTTLEALILATEAQSPGMLCSVLLLDPDGNQLRLGAAPSLPEAYNRAIDGLRIGPGVGSCGTAAWQGESVVVTDIASDPLWRDYKDLALSHGLRACWSTPILNMERRVLGTFAIYFRQPTAPSPSHQRLIELATHTAAIAISRDQNQAALRASEERFRTMAETVGDVFWLAPPSFDRIEYLSPAFERVWGRSPEALYANPSLWLESVQPGDAARVKEARAGLARGRAYNIEFQIALPDGSVRWINDRGYPQTDSSGEILLASGVASDVTQRRSLEEQVRQIQKLEGIGQLAGGVAHDFNNILAATMMHLGLLLEKPGLDTETYESLKELELLNHRAANLTRQLLMFSRRSILQVRPLEIDAVVENLLKMLRRLLGEDIAVEFHAGGGAARIEADAGMIDQVVMNLAVNARDAMPSGGRLIIATKVMTFTEAEAAGNSNRRPGAFVELSVSDTGSGIHPSVLPQIFEPFFTTKEPGKGTGLGLATVDGIIKQHRGWVEVRSTPGQGSTFKVYLPALEEAAREVTADTTVEPMPRGHETILVVEDDEAVRQMLRLTLQALGYRVIVACSGREAVELWARHRSDIALLFTDMVMPEGVSGLDLITRLRQEEPGLKVVITSGYSAEISARGLPSDHGISYLPKPYNGRTLANLVRKALDRS